MAIPTESPRPRLGQYVILEQIGRGGMSVVFRASQESIGREVAVKVLHSSLIQQDPTFLDRFQREVKVCAFLQHPHILPVYDYGQNSGRPFIVMAFVRGGSLDDRIRQGPMSLSEVLPIVGQVADALDFAHAKGVVHRDFKPSNVLLDENGNAYLSDFGLAKVSDAALQLTGSALLGTPDYMAPDLASSEPLSPSVDIYALGITLYQMLTGHVPFTASTPMGVLLAHLSQPVPDVRLERPDLPEAVQQIIATAMAKKANERYGSAGNLAEALRTAAKEPQHTPHALLFTDVQGQVIFVNSQLLRLVNRAEVDVRSVIGKPLHDVLGIAPDAARGLVQDVARIGRLYNRGLDLRGRDGATLPVLCTAEATYDEKGDCIGADLSLRAARDSEASSLEWSVTPDRLDTGERTYLQLYFSSHVNGLRVLLLRVGGPRLGQTLDRILNETSARNDWPVRVNDGKLEVNLLKAETHVYHALLAKAVAYAVKVIGSKMVGRQMKLVDEQMGQVSIDLASRLGLRELLDTQSA
ncbi:MAG TPA: protein kinase [Anaerolineales bacterium]|nr:protein kinase [Anaerolineales bacterium]